MGMDGLDGKEDVDVELKLLTSGVVGSDAWRDAGRPQGIERLEITVVKHGKDLTLNPH